MRSRFGWWRMIEIFQAPWVAACRLTLCRWPHSSWPLRRCRSRPGLMLKYWTPAVRPVIVSLSDIRRHLSQPAYKAHRVPVAPVYLEIRLIIDGMRVLRPGKDLRGPRQRATPPYPEAGSGLLGPLALITVNGCEKLVEQPNCCVTSALVLTGRRCIISIRWFRGSVAAHFLPQISDISRRFRQGYPRIPIGHRDHFTHETRHRNRRRHRRRRIIDDYGHRRPLRPGVASTHAAIIGPHRGHRDAIRGGGEEVPILSPLVLLEPGYHGLMSD